MRRTSIDSVHIGVGRYVITSRQSWCQRYVLGRFTDGIHTPLSNRALGGGATSTAVAAALVDDRNLLGGDWGGDVNVGVHG